MKPSFAYFATAPLNPLSKKERHILLII